MIKPCDCSGAFLGDPSHRSARCNFLAAVVALALLGFGAKAFAQSIKVGYAALVAGQVAVWIAKDGGYLAKRGIDAELIYIPATTATQALIAGEIQLAQVTGVSTAGAILSGADVKIIATEKVFANG